MDQIELDRKEISQLVKKYVTIILEEYKEYIPINIQNKLKSIKDFYDYVLVVPNHTISLFANPINTTIYLPFDAYKAIEILKKLPDYGIDKNHKTYKENNIVLNDNTYRDFVNHVIIKGESCVEYFKEILLHEVMHICGSSGFNALCEGFNELKTREIAEKYGLETSYCGYPKEVKIAYELQQIFGRKIGDKINFLDFKERLILLEQEVGEEAATLYKNIFVSMEKEFRPYITKSYPAFNGIKEKCDEYDKIDYKEVYSFLNNYKDKKKK